MNCTCIKRMLTVDDKMSVFDNTSTTTFSSIEHEDQDLLYLEAFNTPNCTIKISQVKKNNSVLNAVCMFSFGVFGNLLSLFVLKRSDASIRRKLFYRLVAGLTLTDLLGTCATSPVVIQVYVNDFNWIGGDRMCKYFTFMMIFAANGTMAIVCLMAVERLLCIRHPYLYHAKLRKKHATIFLLCAWAYAAFIASLPLIGFGKVILQYPCTWCFIDYYTDDPTDKGFNYMFAIMALLIISVTVTCNGLVLFTLFTTKMRGLSRRNSESFRTFSGYSRRYAECQMAVLLIGITVVFSSCYAPLMIRILLNQTNLLPTNRPLDLLLIRIASMNQILDPWVYILLRREVVWRFVSTLKKLCFCLFCVKRTEYDLTQQDADLYSQRSPSSPSIYRNENKTCMLFCWHCLCDPPQTRRSFSTMSGTYSESYRRTICGPKTGHATKALAKSVTENFILPSASANPENGERRFISRTQFRESSETDIVLLQPSRNSRVRIYSNESKDSRVYSIYSDESEDSRVRIYSDESNSDVCRTLLDTGHADIGENESV